VVGLKLHLENFFAGDLVLAAPSEQLGALACKHAAHDQLDPSALLQTVK
jgi:hypothetical protein